MVASQEKRQPLSTCLKKLFKEALVPYTQFPFHEIMYYTNVDELQACFAPKIMGSVHNALAHTHDYIACSCCPLPCEKETSTSPNVVTTEDTALAYRLYLENGTIINVHDWYKAFAWIANQGQKTDDRAEYDLQ